MLVMVSTIMKVFYFQFLEQKEAGEKLLLVILIKEFVIT